jgi:predicted flap endonuclease-1-like 5' DNA nuclease
MMAKPIEDIEGIGPTHGAALRDAGINTVDKLLEMGGTKKGRAGLAAKTQISEGRLLKWVNMADLFRIKGIASQYAELLEGAGVDTVKELRNRNTENLVAKINEVNAAKKLVRVIPSAEVVGAWIEEAKTLPPKVTH